MATLSSSAFVRAVSAGHEGPQMGDMASSPGIGEVDDRERERSRSPTPEREGDSEALEREPDLIGDGARRTMAQSWMGEPA